MHWSNSVFHESRIAESPHCGLWHYDSLIGFRRKDGDGFTDFHAFVSAHILHLLAALVNLGQPSCSALYHLEGQTGILFIFIFSLTENLGNVVDPRFKS